MSEEPSCLVSYLAHYMTLGDVEFGLIDDLERDERTLGPRQRVVEQGSAAELLFVVKTGWLYQETDLADGRRHIVRTLLPGDLYGLGELGSALASTHLTTCTEVVLCPFPKAAIGEVLMRSPRFGALLLALSSRDQVLYVDRLRAAARLSARARVLGLLLNLRDRLQVTHLDTVDEFRLPLNQSEIGDLLGLTNVSVSKAMVELEQDELIERTRGRVRIHASESAVADVLHVNRYDTLDVAWFPTVGDVRVASL